MTRGIVLLNLLLAALLAAGAYELRSRWLASRVKEVENLGYRPATPNGVQPVQEPGSTKLLAGSFVEIADRFLFSKDRNPVVVIEKKPEPAPKPMPALPNVYGVMDIGAGPTVFMGLAGDAQQGYHPGEKIGEFNLVAADQVNITLEWEGKQITKSIDELRIRSKDPAPASPSYASGNAFSAGAAPPPPKPPENVRPAPGPDIGGGQRGCLAGDPSPDGTVVDGYKKTSKRYAFGPICYWEQSR